MDVPTVRDKQNKKKKKKKKNTALLTKDGLGKFLKFNCLGLLQELWQT